MKLTTNSIFINYRQIDSTDLAKDIESYLEGIFGEGTVFRDKSDIRLTEDWANVLHTGLQTAQIMLSLIGPDWVGSFQDKQKEEDRVEKEISFALSEGIDVVPILFSGVKLPNKQEAPTFFPENLHPILKKQAIVLRKNQKEEGLRALSLSLRELFGDELSADERRATFPKLRLLAALPLPDKPYMKYARQLSSPFLGPVFYGEKEANIFFGRDREIRELFHLVRRYKLVLLRGYSGTGKSSLLHAGLIPRMRQVGSWQVFDPIRRNKQAGGLYQQLQQFVKDQLYALSSVTNILLVLDQVEEMYTDPLPQSSSEIESLGKLLADFRERFPNIHIVLSYRSEYHDKINEEFIDAYDLYENLADMYLGGMLKEGLMKSIGGPQGEGFRFNYELSSELAADIAQDFTGNDLSPYGILFQIQMAELWEAATPDDSGNRLISSQLYQQHKRKELQPFIEESLNRLETEYQESWGPLIEKGLGLDILYGFTSENGTATSKKDVDFFKLYNHLFVNSIEENPSIEILNAFKKNYLLNAAGLQEGESRLAHDTLAPIIIKLYLNSGLASQRARRIIETRKREIEQGFQNVRFSETDIIAFEEGKIAMQAIPGKLQERLIEDQKIFQSQRTNRFEFATNAALRSINNLNYTEALKQLQIAAHERIRYNEIRELAWDLPYVALELEDKDLFLKTLKLLEYVGESCPFIFRWQEKGKHVEIQEARITLQQEMSSSNSSYTSKRQDWYLIQRRRYYPEMIAIPTGEFPMGSEGDICNDESPIHQVKLNAFSLGATAVTFWQYGLYCLLTGEKLPNDSGFGRGDHPVINVDWYKSLAYCNWLSKRKGHEEVIRLNGDSSEVDWLKKGFRLPTEAEWEYAAWLEGGGALFASGENVADPAHINFDPEHGYNSQVQSMYKPGIKRGATLPVKALPLHPNGLGLHGMSGNVYDWCWDWFDATYYTKYDEWENPKGPASSPESKRVIKGGSWFDPGYICRVAFRDYGYRPVNHFNLVGFRVAGYFTL